MIEQKTHHQRIAPCLGRIVAHLAQAKRLIIADDGRRILLVSFPRGNSIGLAFGIGIYRFFVRVPSKTL